ncbi:EcsC family protein [Paenibacillus lutrae]|uniref:EcsC family protein n=1 Tax=Paenibacillus lutrae TaxID=2078573 RepID=A0A7X3FJ45_9BACL|nr:EcsC family protein [Paenibacillus lutrae]MVP00257.1 EcsC family protein [Paenibacillus lutrae]
MNEQESREQLLHELKMIEKWEDDQKGLFFWEKLGRLPFVLLDKLTPKFLQDRIGQLIDEMGSYLQTGGRYLVSQRASLEHLSKHTRIKGDGDKSAVASIEEASRLPLAAMDRAADALSDSRSAMATVQGATTGFGGIFTLAIDIPSLLGLSLKVLQEIAVCYGYDPNDKKERIFIINCLQFSSSDIVGKKAILEKLALYDAPERQNQAAAQIQGWREVIATYRDNFGWKKLFQMIPIAGMLFGAYFNRGTIKDVAEAGKMLYRKRRILERLSTQAPEQRAIPEQPE